MRSLVSMLTLLSILGGGALYTWVGMEAGTASKKQQHSNLQLHLQVSHRFPQTLSMAFQVKMFYLFFKIIFISGRVNELLE